MRKIVVLSFITLDGVVQAPGGPDEDPSNGFRYGGWTVPYFDDFLGKTMGEQMGKDFDLLLGRKTYEIFASYWPFADIKNDPAAAGINRATKYVVSKSLAQVDWKPSVLINGDAAAEIRKVKEDNGPELQVHGSSNLIQTLLRHELVDELRLEIFPVTLGGGKRLFAEGTIPASFELLEGRMSPSGVIVANYSRAGEVKTGSFV